MNNFPMMPQRGWDAMAVDHPPACRYSYPTAPVTPPRKNRQLAYDQQRFTFSPTSVVTHDLCAQDEASLSLPAKPTTSNKTAVVAKKKKSHHKNKKHVSFFSRGSSIRSCKGRCYASVVSHIFDDGHNNDNKVVEMNARGGENEQQPENDELWWSHNDLKQTLHDCKLILKRLKQKPAQKDAYIAHLDRLANSFRQDSTDKPRQPPQSSPQGLVEHDEDLLRQQFRIVAPKVRGLERHLTKHTTRGATSHSQTLLDFQTKLHPLPPHQRPMLLQKLASFSSRQARQLAVKLAEHDAREAVCAILSPWHTSPEEEEMTSQVDGSC